MKNLAFMGYSSYAVSERGEVFSLNSNSFKALAISRDGYLRVYLSAKSKKKWFSVHRLVALAYIPNLGDRKTVNHKDGDKANNFVENLEWSTHEENLNHAIDTGLRELQEFRVDRALTDAQVHAACKYIEDGFRNIDISRMLGINKNYIKNIKSGTQYKDIVSKYSFATVIPTHRKVSTSKLRNICEMIKYGENDETICEKNRVSYNTLLRIRGGDFMPSLVAEYLK